MARRRERIRRKALVVDDTTTLDLANYEPPIKLGDAGQSMWDQLVAAPPFWWTEADLPTAAVMCSALDAVQHAWSDEYGGKGAIYQTWLKYASELGMTPTSRGRLKLTEAQSVTAAKKIEAMEANQKTKATQAVDIDELVDG